MSFTWEETGASLEAVSCSPINLVVPTFCHAMAPSRELRGKRAVTGLPYTFKKRVIPQDDDLDSLELDRLRTAPLPAKPARLPAGQQSLLLSPPRFSTISDNVSKQNNVDIAHLKESVPVDHDEIGRLVTVFGQNQHGAYDEC